MWASASPSERGVAVARAGLTWVVLAIGAGATLAASSVEEALSRLFPPPATATKDTLFLTDRQFAHAQEDAGMTLPSKIVTRYAIRASEEDPAPSLGFAYVDTHLVRTASETLLIVVDPAGAVSRVEVLAFEEPSEYLPSERWLKQFDGRRLDAELQLKRSIRNLSGATLSSRAATDAVRRVLAVHRVVQPAEDTP